MKTLILLLSITVLNAFALDHFLMKITNDEDSDVVTFILQTDASNKTITSMVKSVYDKNMNHLNSYKFTADQVQKSGALLSESSGRKVVVLNTKSTFSTATGGMVELDYLVNGISGSRAKFPFSLVRSGNTWIASKDGKAIKLMHFKSNKKPLVGTVGISTIVAK